MGNNLYVHFPFCRRKCAYCALPSRPGSSSEEREEYAASIADRIRRLAPRLDGLDTVYFGGGTPALCDLSPVLDALAPLLLPEAEFTVELHPHDVSEDLLSRLRDGGVNRISMGVQSLEDDVLVSMGRGYSVAEAERAFGLVRGKFDNAGIDLIVGYPHERGDWAERLPRLADWGLAHCSVYALQNERGLADVADDETAMSRIAVASACLGGIGLVRYEISNYAVPGRECRHNLSVWRGEDYFGLGRWAHGRLGLLRTVDYLGPTEESETVTQAFDWAERRVFRLRLREGLDLAKLGDVPPHWAEHMDRCVRERLLLRDGSVYRLTARGTEVCDSILAELV